jgi:hypothetical protein
LNFTNKIDTRAYSKRVLSSKFQEQNFLLFALLLGFPRLLGLELGLRTACIHAGKHGTSLHLNHRPHPPAVTTF